MSGEATNLRRNILLVGAANLFSRITGLVRDIAFAATFGAGVQADAYNAAFRIGSLFRELFAEGSLSSAFIPLYADVEEKEGIDSAFALANAFLGVLLVAVGVVTILTFTLAEPLVYMIASGFDQTPGKVEITATLTRVLSPFVAAVSIAAVFMGMLNVRGRFFLPAAVPVVFNVLVIAACVGAPVFGETTGLDPIFGVAIAALIGGGGQALIQIPTLRKTGFRFRPTLGNHPALKRLLKFLAPALVAISVVQVNLLIETQLASLEGDGPVSWLLYSFKIVHLPLSIVSVAVGVASLAGLSVLAAQGSWDRFRDTLTRALSLNTFLLLPSAVGLFLLAEPIVALLLERGAFLPADTAATAALLRMYCIAVLGIGAHRVLIPVYYTLDDPKTPMWVGLGTVALKLPVALTLMYPLGMGVEGLPLSHGILVTAEVALLVWFLTRRVDGLLRPLVKDHARIAIAAVIMGGVVWWVREMILPGPVGLPALLGVIGLGAAVYFLAAAALGLKEGREVLGRLLKRRPRGLPPTVDPDTARTLEAMAAGPVGAPAVEGGVARIATPEGAVVIGAVNGALTARLEPGAPVEDLHPRAIAAVMKIGGGPPKLGGLKIGDADLRAEEDQVVAAAAVGPVITLGDTPETP